MNTNVKAIINLMQTLGVTLEELISSLPSKDVGEALQTCIANDSINLQTLFSPESEAFEKLVEFVAGEDFGTPPKIPEKVTKQIEYAVTSNGMTYAKYEGKVLGLVFNSSSDGKFLGLVFNSSSNGKFIFALRNNGYNKPIKIAREEAEGLPKVAGRKWCVPSDSHFKAIREYGVSKVNNALKELRGDEIGNLGFLSSTSQANQPSRWCVRFVLPLN
ncbi:MAG: hypothetical protein NC218_11270 [Acetobacter sp.]|nr:hypothetical protein [Acetobacter sp.]